MPAANNAPIDKDVVVPAAVRAAAAKADQIHQQAYQTDPAVTPVPAQDPPAAPAAAPVPVQDPPPAPAQAAAPIDEGTWEERYKSMKGRYDKAQLQVNQLGDRTAALETMLANIPRTPAPQPAPVPRELQASSLVTAEEKAAYGDEFLDVVARRATEALQPRFDAMQAENETLKRQLAQVNGTVTMGAREQMFKHLDEQLPAWRDQNQDAAFLNWLRLPDPYSGAIRSVLLKSAFDRNDTSRVLAFFKGFLTEEAAVDPALSPPATPAAPAKPGLETFAAPGRAKSAAAANQGGSPEKPIITRAQIAQFYVNVGKGMYLGKDKEKAADEAIIFAAQRDGRIR